MTMECYVPSAKRALKAAIVNRVPLPERVDLRQYEPRRLHVMRGRWVGAESRSGHVLHAVWVTHDTPVPEPGQPPPSREGLSACGVFTPRVIAGPQGGHDWDRQVSRTQCANCRRVLAAGG